MTGVQTCALPISSTTPRSSSTPTRSRQILPFGSNSSKTPSRSRSRWFKASKDVKPIPFINLSSEEEDPDLAWARADHYSTEQARQSAGQARNSEYEEDLQKAVALSLADQEGESKVKGKRNGKGKGNVPMEVEGKCESKDPIEVDDDDSDDNADMYFKQLWID